MSISYNSVLVNKIISDFQGGNKEKAIDQLNLFLEKNPSDYTARYNLALMYDNTNKIDLAIKNYTKVIKEDQSHWRSRFNLYLILIISLFFGLEPSLDVYLNTLYFFSMSLWFR